MQARACRDVFVVDEIDGLSTLMARLSTETAHALMSAINAATGSTGHDSAGTVGERRCAVLVDLLLGPTAGATASPAPSVVANLDILIDLPTLASLRADAVADGPVELAGAGPMVADALLDLLLDPRVGITMRRLVVDPDTRHLLDVGRRRYEVTDALRGFIVSRDRTCRFPGCRRPARLCQIDHAEAWQDGGSTDIANLGALCTRHHQLKTHGGWDLDPLGPDGSCRWTSPLRRTHEHAPTAFLAAGAGPPPG
jgi:hypothetical protein